MKKIAKIATYGCVVLGCVALTASALAEPASINNANTQTTPTTLQQPTTNQTTNEQAVNNQQQQDNTTTQTDAKQVMPAIPLATMVEQKLTQKIKGYLALNIQVTNVDGHITLAGQATNKAQAMQIVEYVQSVPGVLELNAAKLTVKDSNVSLKDAFISAKVKGLFLREADKYKIYGILPSLTVKTKKGVVTISGNVHHEAMIFRAVGLAHHVTGVKRVKAKIKVQ